MVMPLLLLPPVPWARQVSDHDSPISTTSLPSLVPDHGLTPCLLVACRMVSVGSASRKRASPGADTTGSQHEEDVVDISQDDDEERRQTTPSSTSDTPRKRAARW